MSTGPETRVVHQIVSALESRGAVVEKMHGSRYMTMGLPDLIGVLPGGRAIVVEVKRADGGASTIKQREVLWRWAAAGAVAICEARSVDDVIGPWLG